jgi:hypothetical protein
MGIKNLMKLIEEYAGHAIRSATQKNYFKINENFLLLIFFQFTN